ncbi:MAG: hypothetical protein WBV78_03700, partial [Roseobacter sp.]
VSCLYETCLNNLTPALCRRFFVLQHPHLFERALPSFSVATVNSDLRFSLRVQQDMMCRVQHKPQRQGTWS